MKKITKIAATFAAAMAIFLGASCSHDGGASLATLGGGGGSTTTTDPVVVDAVWDFATQPTGFPLTDTENDAVTAFKLSPKSGSGATLTATGRWKWDNEYLQAQSSSGKTVSEAAGWTSTSSGKFLTLTLEGDANVTVEYTGSGALANQRWVAILDGDNTVKFSTPATGIGSDPKNTKTLPLTKGTYTIAANAARIYSITCAQEKKDEGNGDEGNEGEGDEGDEGDGEEESPIVVETKDTYTEYFDGEANIYNGATFSGIFAGGAVGTDSDGKTKTYEFASGVKWVLGTGGKIEANTTAFNTYTAKYRLALDKTGNNGALTVPVKGAATVTFGFQNNNNGRGFTVTSKTAAISNENVQHCSSDQTNGTVSASGNTLTYEVTGKSNNELISFDVDGADTLTIEATDGTSSGSVYIFFIDVKAK